MARAQGHWSRALGPAWSLGPRPCALVPGYRSLGPVPWSRALGPVPWSRALRPGPMVPGVKLKTKGPGPWALVPRVPGPWSQGSQALVPRVPGPVVPRVPGPGPWSQGSEGAQGAPEFRPAQGSGALGPGPKGPKEPKGAQGPPPGCRCGEPPTVFTPIRQTNPARHFQSAGMLNPTT